MRWGILGTGAVAAAFVEGLAFVDGATATVVGSRTASRAEEFAARWGVERAVGSYDEVVTDPAVDVVYIATENEYHRDHMLLALAAGKPTLCEKPFALDAAQGAEIVEAARTAGVFCMEAMWMRCSPVVQEVLRRIRTGAVGDVKMVTAQLGFANAVDPNSRLFRPNGGGALLDLGVYPVSFVHAVLGPPSEVTSSAVMGTTGVDEQVTAILRYDHGALASVSAGIRSQLSNSAEISGTSGVITVEPPLVFPHRFRHQAVGVRHGRSDPSSWGGWRTKLRQHPAGRRAAEARQWASARPSTRRAPGNGYSAEAVEVERALALGLLESPLMRLAESVEILATLDIIRSTWTD